MKFEIKRVGLESVDLIQKILESSPIYFRKVDGCQVQPHFAKRELTDGPEKRSAIYEKCFSLIIGDGLPIGVADLHKNHPAQGIVYLGLLLLDENFHGEGLGRKAYGAVEEFAKIHLDANKMRLGVSDRNQVTDFWLKMGFVPNGHTYVWKGEKVESVVMEMDKELS